MTLLRTANLRRLAEAALTAIMLLVAGAAASAEPERFLGRISPVDDRVALTRALARVLGEEPYCLGIAAQGSNVLLSRSRREPEAETGVVFPTLVDNTTPGRIRVELEALTHAGLIELATMEGFETYRLTGLGRQYYDVGRHDFCTKGIELIELVALSEEPPGQAAAVVGSPAQSQAEDEGGVSKSRLFATYRFRVANPPAWTRDKGLRRVYPQLSILDGALAVAVLQEGRDGWSLVANRPAAL